jgi:LysM repeat protein
MFFKAAAFAALVFFGLWGVQARPQNHGKDELSIPSELRLKVEFWKAIYTKYKTTQGLLHDAEDLSVIYDAIELPRNGSTLAADELRYVIRERLFNIVRKRGENLTPEERKLLSHFPPGTTRTRLLQATENIRFQLGQSDRFKEGIVRSGYYLKHIEKILQEQGLPDFVKYLPHVESSFQEYAISKVDAAGLWQLMESTARNFGLRIDYAIDERLDPWLATEAAAKHLKRDRNYLGAWPLALTAYNHGPGGVQKAVQTLGTTDIAEIAFRYTSPTFGFASRNFYAQFLAAAEVASNYQKYFGDLPVRPPLAFDSLSMTSATYFKELNQKYKFTLDEFKRLNPALRAPVLLNQRPIPKGTLVRVPMNSKRPPVLVASLEKKAVVPKPVVEVPKLAELKAAVQVKKVELPKVVPVKSEFTIEDIKGSNPWIRLQINETLAQVADWLGLSVDRVRDWNGLTEDEQARIGQKLIVKFEAVNADEFASRREDYHNKIREDFFARYEVATLSDYEVKQGENLWSICYQKFDVPPWLLQEYNVKVSVANLSAGSKIKIPVLKERDINMASATR